MNNDTKEAAAIAALALPILPFAYIGIPILMAVIAYSMASGTQAFLSLPAWVIALTAGALAAGTIACIRGRVSGVLHAPIAALALILVSGLVQANREMFAPVADSGSPPGSPLSHVADNLASSLAIGLPWILALVVIGISAAKIADYAAKLKALRTTR